MDNSVMHNSKRVSFVFIIFVILSLVTLSSFYPVSAEDISEFPSGKSPDFDSNGIVGLSDFFMFADYFGKNVTIENRKFDINSDDKINFDDFFMFTDWFGKNVSLNITSTTSCYNFTNLSACMTNTVLNSNIRCIWDSGEDDPGDLTDTSRTPACIAVSDTCEPLGEADCKTSGRQGLTCVWNNNRCVRYTPSTTTGIRAKSITLNDPNFGSSSAFYCPQYSTMMDWNTFRRDCPPGCVAEGGISSPLYCVFPGRFYTNAEVQAARAGAAQPSYNPCLQMSYCECIAGGLDQPNCGRIQSKSSSGGYYNTLGQISGCIWNGDPNGGTCMTAEQMSYFSDEAGSSPSAGRSCPYVGALQADRNECFVCGPDSRWTKVQESQDLLEPTICNSVASVNPQAAEALIERAAEDTRLNQAAIQNYQENILPQMAQSVQGDRIRDLDRQVAAENRIIENNGGVSGAIQRGLLNNFDEFYYTQKGALPKQPLGCVDGSVCGNGGMCFDSRNQCFTCSGEERYYDMNGDNAGDIKFYRRTDNSVCEQIRSNENLGMNVDSAYYSTETAKDGSTIIESSYTLSFSTPSGYGSDWTINSYKIAVQSTKVTGEYPLDSTNRKTQLSIKKFTDFEEHQVNGRGKRYDVFEWKDGNGNGKMEPDEFKVSLEILYENQGRKVKRVLDKYIVTPTEITEIKEELQRQLSAAASQG